MSEKNETILGNMILALGDAFAKERQKSEPYKEMFKAGSTHTGLLRDLDTKMTVHVLDACDIFEQRHGVKLNRAQYHILLALPLLATIAESEAEKKEGSACCADKAFYILSEQILALGESKD